MNLLEKKEGSLFMAFGAGSESTETKEFSKYIGVGVVKVLAVNPTRAELENIYGRAFDKDPEYITIKDGVKSARISFIVEVVADKNNGLHTIVPITYFLRNELTGNRDNTKVCVIDKYGETAWATSEEYKAGIAPAYSQRLIPPFKAALRGEENLVKFLKALINIPNSTVYKNEQWEKTEKLQDCEAGLEKINNYFNGDFSELKQLIKFRPDNMMKLCFGVRTTAENKQYQDFFTEMPMKLGVSNYSRLDKEIQEAKQNNRYADTVFDICNLKEFVEESTSFAPAQDAPAANLPWLSK